MSIPINQYPYTNLHEINLDWVLSHMKQFEDDISNLKTRMITAESNITNLQGRMSTAENYITNLQGRMSTAEDYIDNLRGRMTTAESNITNLQGRMSTAEGKITNLENKTSYILQSNIDYYIQDVYDTSLQTHSYRLRKGGPEGDTIALNINGQRRTFIENLIGKPQTSQGATIYPSINVGVFGTDTLMDDIFHGSYFVRSYDLTSSYATAVIDFVFTYVKGNKIQGYLYTLTLTNSASGISWTRKEIDKGVTSEQRNLTFYSADFVANDNTHFSNNYPYKIVVNDLEVDQISQVDVYFADGMTYQTASPKVCSYVRTFNNYFEIYTTEIISGLMIKYFVTGGYPTI